MAADSIGTELNEKNIKKAFLADHVIIRDSSLEITWDKPISEKSRENNVVYANRFLAELELKKLLSRGLPFFASGYDGNFSKVLDFNCEAIDVKDYFRACNVSSTKNSLSMNMQNPQIEDYLYDRVAHPERAWRGR